MPHATIIVALRHQRVDAFVFGRDGALDAGGGAACEKSPIGVIARRSRRAAPLFVPARRRRSAQSAVGDELGGALGRLDGAAVLPYEFRKEAVLSSLVRAEGVVMLNS